jgi:ParB/RepB/Spo0J family partition protein
MAKLSGNFGASKAGGLNTNSDVSGVVKSLPIDQIKESGNVRSEYDQESINDLAESIQKAELLNPLTVREVPGGYELIAGHRRLRALRLLKWTEAPVIIIKSDKDLAYLQLIENLVREDISPADRERAIKSLNDAGMKQIEIAFLLGRSKGQISKILTAAKERETLTESFPGETVKKIGTRELYEKKKKPKRMTAPEPARPDIPLNGADIQDLETPPDVRKEVIFERTEPVIKYDKKYKKELEDVLKKAGFKVTFY